MYTHNGNVFTVLFVFGACLLFVKCCSVDKALTKKELLYNPSSIFAVFDPYVSILDKCNPYRYNVTDMLPLVAKVASKFNRLLIELSCTDLENETSKLLSPIAVATHNKLTSENSKKVEIWLLYGAMISDDDYRNRTRLIARFLDVAKKANDIHNGTVSLLLVRYQLNLGLFEEDFKDIKKIMMSGYGYFKRGILLDVDEVYQRSEAAELVLDMKPDIVILVPKPFNQDSNPLTSLKSSLKDFNQYILKKTIDEIFVAFYVTVSDTNLNGEVCMSDFISVLNQITEWTQENDMPVIISQAFDTPYAESFLQKTNGLWRLVENPLYNTTVDYIFEEKNALSKQKEGKEITFAQLNNSISFNKNHVQLIFSLYGVKKAKRHQRWSDNETNSLLKNIIPKFSKLIFLVHDDSRLAARSHSEESDFLNKIDPSAIELRAAILSHLSLKGLKEIEASIGEELLNVSHPLLLVINPINKETAAPTLKEWKIKNQRASKEKKESAGILLNISICTQLAKMNDENAKITKNIMSDADFKNFVFFFAEDEETVKLGADRMLLRRVISMEHCRKMVLQHRNMSSESVKLSFMLLHYAAPSNFYKSKWAMINFIQYWKLLGDWAVKANTTVILSNAVDGSRRYKGETQPVTELGWWRHRDDITEEHLKERVSKVWLDKIEEGLLRFPDLIISSADSNPSMESFTTVQILLFILLIVICCLLFILISILLKRRRNKYVYLTKTEANQFFNGDINSQETTETPGKAAYNKSRYEISSNAFTIEEDKTLGSGEFGKVCVGSIKLNVEMDKVAIKMINPERIHKTTVSGFLSEIKVLSHVGKHSNIIELIGANTSDVRCGKVYIFLEFCELGSLEKYLLQMRVGVEELETLNEIGGAEMDYDTLEEYIIRKQSSTYSLVSQSSVKSEIVKSTKIHDDKEDQNKQFHAIPMLEMGKPNLDSSLSNDMYRWSQEICNGMAYLASKHVVHADLATRNVLLNADKVAKICDFGLSRRMYNYANYVKQQQEPLPWKWMSPEALKLMEFNEKSDVWAYGITLWEIYSLGEKPYPGLSWDANFANMLERGLRMDMPKYHNKNVYEIMKRCWTIHPGSRPPFSTLLSLLSCDA